MKKYTFAQSLDNTSEDIILAELTAIESNSPKRKEIANEIFRISTKGKLIFSYVNGTKIYAYGKKYIVNLPTRELDVAGRKSLLTFLFDLNEIGNVANLKNDLKLYIEKAAEYCQRTIETKDIDVILDNLSRDLKKSPNLEIPENILKALVLIGLGILAIYVILTLRE